MSEENGEEAALFDSRVGTVLRDARESRELTLEEVAKVTRIPLRHLANIEAGDYDALPAPTYSTGFVKAYARAVGLDQNALAQSFRDEIQFRTSSETSRDYFEPADPARVPPRGLAWIALAIAIVLALGYGLWRSGAFGDDAVDRAQLAAGTDETGAAPAQGAERQARQPSETVPANGPVVLEAEDVVWMRIYERESDEVLFQGELQPGERFEVPAGAENPAIRTARAESIRVTVGGRRVAPLGPPSATIRDVSLRPADLVRRPSAETASEEARRPEPRETETRTTETRPAPARTTEGRQAESRPAETRPAPARQTPPRQPEQRPAPPPAESAPPPAETPAEGDTEQP